MNQEINKDYSFTVVDDNGNEVICDVISMLKDKKTNELFVLYTDYTTDKDEKFNLYLSELKEDKGGYILNAIKSKERYNQILKETEVLYGKAVEEWHEA